jgi:hypothetical protein
MKILILKNPPYINFLSNYLDFLPLINMLNEGLIQVEFSALKAEFVIVSSYGFPYDMI